MTPVVFISAGEASGEHYGALLAVELRRRLGAAGVSAKLFGMGGQRMEAAGVERVVRLEDMAVMGLTEVVHHLPRIYREFRRLKRAIRTRRPDVAVLIDFPEVHFRLAKECQRLGIPVIYFVSPQLWAWKEHRIRLVRKYVRRMLVIFPFEEPFYRKRGVIAEFVGHPLADLPLPTISREQFAAENGLDAAKTWIGLLPGSRLREVEDHLPEMLEAARGLVGAAQPSSGSVHEGPPSGANAVDDFRPVDVRAEARTLQNSSGVDHSPRPSGMYEFLIPLAPTLNAAQREAVLQMAAEHGGGLAVRLLDDARAALFHARASVVASGTATVEAALIGNPFVVVYRVSPLTYAIAKRVVKVPHVAMANLIAGKRVVPELIQNDFTAANIVQHLNRLLPDGPARESMTVGLRAIREALQGQTVNGPSQGQRAIERVAAIVAQEVEAVYPAAAEAARP